nr:immunoglobulin heavy chain junction region [Mus musculus]NSM05466.1 immunoglobulin heavy chain junction region [Mus musculus]NSM05610.1 immunoglobulin heavy chain junction region [Mus musculus]NSM05883.1 immunoglobulin heavy chain junction region [Mus musculus]NSM08832.1 immunoglobulin heavy chain junction region [Mus musculus]
CTRYPYSNYVGSYFDVW